MVQITDHEGSGRIWRPSTKTSMASVHLNREKGRKPQTIQYTKELKEDVDQQFDDDKIRTDSRQKQ